MAQSLPSAYPRQAESTPVINLVPRLVRDEEAPDYDGQPQWEPFSVIPATLRDLRDGYAKAVYLCLADHANAEGVCWPSMKTLCEETGWSPKLVRPAIQRLIEAGLIGREQRISPYGDYDSCLYRLRQHRSRVGSVGTNPSSESNNGTFPQNQGLVPTERGVSSQGTKNYIPENDIPKEQEPRKKSSSPLNPPTPKAEPEGFTEFWTAYPRHEEKQAALKQWQTLSPDAALRATILSAIAAQKQSRKWRDGYIKYAHRWLRDRNWEDEVAPVAANDHAPEPLDEIEAIRQSRDLKYFGTIGMKRREADIASALARRNGHVG